MNQGKEMKVRQQKITKEKNNYRLQILSIKLNTGYIFKADQFSQK